MAIAADGQPCLGAGDGLDLDIAGIKGGVDVNMRHGFPVSKQHKGRAGVPHCAIGGTCGGAMQARVLGGG